jgi:hypothetical protein
MVSEIEVINAGTEGGNDRSARSAITPGSTLRSVRLVSSRCMYRMWGRSPETARKAVQRPSDEPRFPPPHGSLEWTGRGGSKGLGHFTRATISTRRLPHWSRPAACANRARSFRRRAEQPSRRVKFLVLRLHSLRSTALRLRPPLAPTPTKPKDGALPQRRKIQSDR